MFHFTLLSAFVTAGVVLAVYVAYELLQRAFRAHKSPLGNIPGPKLVNLLRGSFTHADESDAYRLMEQWIDKYGHTFKYTSFFGVRLQSGLHRVGAWWLMFCDICSAVIPV